MFTHDFEAGPADPIAAKLITVARYVALVIFGLLPVIFIPGLVTPLGYTKIMVASVGLFFAIIFCAFSVLRQGAVRVRFELPVLFLWVAFLVAIVSGLFSGDFFDSFWGTELSAHSGVFVGILALTMTAWMFIATHKQTVIRLYLLLGLSAVLLAVFHLFRIFFGAGFLSFGVFGGNLVATPFSEWNSLAIFFGLVIILSQIALEQLTLNAMGRALFAVAMIASLVMLTIINFEAVFVVLGLVSLVVIIYALTKGRFRPASTVIATRSAASSVSIVVSLITLVVSIIFVVGGSPMGAAVSRMTGISYIEVRPSMKATTGIAEEVYKGHALLGVGPNRFVDAWRLHRDPSINSTIFWNTNFQAGFGYIPTIFVTQGVLGGIAWLAFFMSFLYIGFRTLMRTLHADMMWYFIALSSFVASVYLWGMSLIYVPGSVLLLLAALCSGVFLAARQAIMPDAGTAFSFMQNQRAVFVTIAATVLVVVISVGTLYYMGRYYVATTLFVQGVTEINRGGNLDSGMQQIVRAFDLSRDDVFARQVATYQQVRLQQKVAGALQSQQLSKEQWAELQQYIVSGVQAAKTATDIDSTEPDNWGILGRVYASAVPLNIDQAYELSKDALEKARALDPQNPERLVTLAELELLKHNNAAARDYVNRAIALKSNYTDAMYLLTQIEVADGNVVAAVEATRATTVLDPQNPVRFFQLGVLEYSLKHLPEAQQAFEQAIALSNDYSNARYFLAFVYDAEGRKGDAKKQLEEVLARNPDSEQVKQLLQNLGQTNSLTPVALQQGNQPVKENSESSKNGAPVTSGQAPDSPLLSPVNGDTKQQTQAKP